MNYLIYGNSNKMIDAEVEKILNGRKKDIYNLDEVMLSEVLEDISYNSMFDSDKIIILKNFNTILNSKKEENLNPLLTYLKKPNTNTILIFLSNEKITSKGINKEILSFLKIIETPIITKSYELSKILGDIIRKEGYGITPNVLNIFVEKCASNYDIAINEYEKLKIIKKNNRLISETDVENYISNYNSDDIFSFKDAVINKNIEKSFKMLEELENAKIEPISIVVMLAKEYQVIYNIKILVEKKLTNEQISDRLDKMHPYRVKLLRECANKYSTTELEKLILYLCDLDLKLVSEDNLGLDEIKKFILLL